MRVEVPRCRLWGRSLASHGSEMVNAFKGVPLRSSVLFGSRAPVPSLQLPGASRGAESSGAQRPSILNSRFSGESPSKIL